MKILVAEDDSVSLLVLRALLEQRGHEVTAATNGAEAWRIYQAERHPVAILDWMMPEMDGLELCRNIRGMTRSDKGAYTCVIMLTAKQEREDRLQALSAGADVFLTKPLNRDDMIARLQVAERILSMETAAAAAR